MWEERPSRRLNRRLRSGTDLWIVWTPETREKTLCKVVNNSLFLILPHLWVPHLALHLLWWLL